MKTFQQTGNVLRLTMPYDRLSGQGVKVGQIFGIVAHDALETQEAEVHVVGVYEINKVGSQAWTAGALVYWDDTNRHATTVAASNLLIGAATAPVGDGAGATTGTVRLNGSFRATEAGG